MVEALEHTHTYIHTHTYMHTHTLLYTNTQQCLSFSNVQDPSGTGLILTSYVADVSFTVTPLAVPDDSSGSGPMLTFSLEASVYTYTHTRTHTHTSKFKIFNRIFALLYIVVLDVSREARLFGFALCKLTLFHEQTVECVSFSFAACKPI